MGYALHPARIPTKTEALFLQKIGRFEGFPLEMFEFFMAISFNNNTEFFHENRDKYEKHVKAPLYALAAELADTVRLVDPEMEVRPYKVVSRLRRDVRFSANKLPYRDHMWLGWRPAGRPKSLCFGLYLEVNCNCVSYGIGWYDNDPARAKAIRRQLRARMDEFLPIAQDKRLNARYTLNGAFYKRMEIPEGFPEALVPYYKAKGFYLEHTEPLTKKHREAAFVEDVKKDLLILKDMYAFFRDLPLEGIDESAD